MAITFENAEVLQRHGFEKTPLSIAEGLIVEDGAGRAIDLTGYHILPGIVDLHGDGFERHLAPRR
ncbi:MAG: alpha-D-ribose 1-methylphosphonate 5-triphosphate diphosphatase, partial [Paracoccaceae bacterium]